MNTSTLISENPLIAGMQKDLNKSAYTAKGAISNASTLSHVVDFFGAGAALRNADESRVLDLFGQAFAEDRLLALKTAFYFRDARCGQGERKTFRTIISHLANFFPEVLRKNLSLIPFYGRWDDLFVLEGTKVWPDVIQLIDNQLVADRKALKKEGNVSLLAKWMPSINTSSKETRALAQKFISEFGLDAKSYRKMLSKLRKYINVVETKMSANKFSEIDYSTVPSRASMIYRKAFSKRDADRYVNFLQKVEKGEAKINASVLYPYDVIRNVANTSVNDPTLDAQWKALPNYIKRPKNALVMADVSGSMSMTTGSNVRPIDVCLSLAIYIAERNKGPFQDYFMSFSSTPALHKLKGSTIFEKYASLNQATVGYSTDIQAGFDLILLTAVNKNIRQEDMPETLLVISDMQFDSADVGGKRTNFQEIDRKFKFAGYKRPQLVFWNVNASGSKQFPITIDDSGTALVSGCSPVILTSVLNGEVITPLDVLNKTVNIERYAQITV